MFAVSRLVCQMIFQVEDRDSPMETRQCRFCLSSNDAEINQLISPCNCKGSIKFVHSNCLNRWRYVDIERNGRTCSLCMTRYILPRLYEYEVVPKLNTLTLYVINYPGLTLSFYHYIFIVIISSSQNTNTLQNIQTIYNGSQYIFHGIYAVLLAQNWKVHNKAMYFAHVKTIWPFLFLAFHGLLLSLFQQSPQCIGPLLSFYLGVYWKFHTRVLQKINERVLESELVEEREN